MKNRSGLILDRRMAIGFVTFNEMLSFKDKVNTLIEHGYGVYVYDNSPETGNALRYIDCNGERKIRYFTCGQNIGLGVGMSTICAHAYYDGYDCLLFFDQDTRFTIKTIEFVLKLLSLVPIKEFSAISLTNDRYSSGDWNAPKESNRSDILVEERLLIRNSGSIFVLSALSEIGWFNTSYFVDGVDYEFSLRSHLDDYKIGCVEGVPDFDHESNGRGVWFRARAHSPLKK